MSVPRGNPGTDRSGGTRRGRGNGEGGTQRLRQGRGRIWREPEMEWTLPSSCAEGQENSEEGVRTVSRALVARGSGGPGAKFALRGRDEVHEGSVVVRFTSRGSPRAEDGKGHAERREVEAGAATDRSLRTRVYTLKNPSTPRELRRRVTGEARVALERLRGRSHDLAVASASAEAGRRSSPDSGQPAGDSMGEAPAVLVLGSQVPAALARWSGSPLQQVAEDRSSALPLAEASR